MMTPAYQLIMRQGPNPGFTFDLVKPEISIGRDMTNDIVINDGEVSRKHAVLRLSAGSYVIEDLGSTNGTFVNGQRLIGPHSLSVGEVITLGEIVMLAFDAVSPDLAKTMIGTSMIGTSVNALPPVQPSFQQQPSQPVYILPPAPPTPKYDELPVFPADEAQMEPAEVKSNRGLWMLAGCGCLVLLAITCATAAIAIDYFDLWCTLFGSLIPGC
jgi:hypothetical protein